MTSAMKTPRTLNIISECWNKAEFNLRRSIKKKHRDPDEEFITRLFCGEFSFSLRKATEQGLIRKAFLEDLRYTYPESHYDHELNLIAENLVADVSLHKRHIETITGGDFGLTITRPDISFSEHPHYSNTGYLEIDEAYQRGLLCQAKLKHDSKHKPNSTWNTLTENQKKVLLEKTPYLSLLLYEFSDKEHQGLKPFVWQLCNQKTVDEINDWLKSGLFPSLTSSSGIIKQLGNAEIGTDDEQVLKDIIRPAGKPQFSIKIYWPDDKKPPNSISITHYSNSTQKIDKQQKIYLHR